MHVPAVHHGEREAYAKYVRATRLKEIYPVVGAARNARVSCTLGRKKPRGLLMAIEESIILGAMSTPPLHFSLNEIRPYFLQKGAEQLLAWV